MSALLIVTAGQTDVQLVDGRSRVEFAKECGALHDELRRRQEDWTFPDAPPKKAGSISKLPASAFQICTPKLDAVIKYISGRALRPTFALILDTRTNDGRDPRFAGEVLELRLRQQLRIPVQRTTFLEGAEKLFDRKDPRDALIRRHIVSKIEEAASNAIETSAALYVTVAATGGFPAVATLLEEIVRLHSGTPVQVELLEVPDAAKFDDGGEEQAVPRRSIPEPIESFRARRHAIELVEQGNFLGAWGAVKHLDQDQAEQDWTKVIQWLYFFAASLPIPVDCDLPLLVHPKMAVRAAIRVELALRSGDIPRAVHGTVTFFESALWDHLLDHMKPHPTNKRLYEVATAPPECLVRSRGSTDHQENRKRPFERISENGTSYYSIFDENVCAIRLAKYYLQNEGLVKLGQSISSDIRGLRNDVAHNEPTPALMAAAHSRMVSENLWSSNSRFLEMPMVQQVLRDLGASNPQGMCDDLIGTVRARLLKRTQDPPQPPI